jgi:hypothetical protein
MLPQRAVLPHHCCPDVFCPLVLSRGVHRCARAQIHGELLLSQHVEMVVLHPGDAAVLAAREDPRSKGVLGGGPAGMAGGGGGVGGERVDMEALLAALRGACGGAPVCQLDERDTADHGRGDADGPFAPRGFAPEFGHHGLSPGLASGGPLPVRGLGYHMG